VFHTEGLPPASLFDADVGDLKDTRTAECFPRFRLILVLRVYLTVMLVIPARACFWRAPYRLRHIANSFAPSDSARTGRLPVTFGASFIAAASASS